MGHPIRRKANCDPQVEWWQLCVPLIIGASLLQPKSAGRAGVWPGWFRRCSARRRWRWTRLAVVAMSLRVLHLWVVGGSLPLVAAARALRGPPPAPGRSLPGVLLMLGGTGAIGSGRRPSSPRPGSSRCSPGPGHHRRMVDTGARGAAGPAPAGSGMAGPHAIGARVSPQPSRARRGFREQAPALLLGGALLVLAGPHAGLVIGGMLLASVGAELVFRRGKRRVPVLLVVTLALVPAYWLLHTVAGPIGLGVGTLDQVPLSPAAARLVALPLGLVAWAWMGLWPLHGVVRPVLLAPLGAALWLRVAAPVAAEGLVHWQPLLRDARGGGLWHAAAAGRLASVFVGARLCRACESRSSSVAAAALLLARRHSRSSCPAEARRSARSHSMRCVASASLRRRSARCSALRRGFVPRSCSPCSPPRAWPTGIARRRRVNRPLERTEQNVRRPSHEPLRGTSMLAWIVSSMLLGATAPAETTLVVNAVVVDGTGAPGRRASVRIAAAGSSRSAHSRARPATVSWTRAGWSSRRDSSTPTRTTTTLFTRPDALAAVSQGITTVVVGQDGGHPHPARRLLPPARARAGRGQRGLLRRPRHDAPAGAGRRLPPRGLRRRGGLDGQAARAPTSTPARWASPPGSSTTPGSTRRRTRCSRWRAIAAAAGGRYISHVRSEDRKFYSAVDEMLAIGREARLPVQISHAKLAMRSLWGQRAEAARRARQRAEARAWTSPPTSTRTLYWQSTLTVLFPARNFDDLERARRGARTRWRPPTGYPVHRRAPTPSLRRPDRRRDRPGARRGAGGDAAAAGPATPRRIERATAATTSIWASSAPAWPRRHRDAPRLAARQRLQRRRSWRRPPARLRRVPARARPLRARAEACWRSRRRCAR